LEASTNAVLNYDVKKYSPLKLLLSNGYASSFDLQVEGKRGHRPCQANCDEDHNTATPKANARLAGSTSCERNVNRKVAKAGG
jgi:hypothetical protein